MSKKPDLMEYVFGNPPNELTGFLVAFGVLVLVLAVGGLIFYLGEIIGYFLAALIVVGGLFLLLLWLTLRRRDKEHPD